MIPIILLGDREDRVVCDTLYLHLKENCAIIRKADFCWQKQARFLLIDSPTANYLDAGGGFVILKESFRKDHAPKHLLHAKCIFLSECKEAAEFVTEYGLPSIACGGCFDPLSFSSMKEQTVLSVQGEIHCVDGTMVPQGDFPLSLGGNQELSAGGMLLSAAALLVLGELGVK